MSQVQLNNLVGSGLQRSAPSKISITPGGVTASASSTASAGVLDQLNSALNSNPYNFGFQSQQHSPFQQISGQMQGQQPDMMQQMFQFMAQMIMQILGFIMQMMGGGQNQQQLPGQMF
jgi:hypothetical protein